MHPLVSKDPGHIGPYRLTHLLGSGGMGRVYLGRTRAGRKVAIKVIHALFAEDDGFRLRFAREVEAARRVGGFHTAQVVDADPNSEEPWVASAHIPGPSLHEVVAERGPLPEPTLRVLVAGLAEGLAAIHEAGLAHRDLKPSNILLNEEGARIIDFGVARLAEDTRITRTGMMLGTPAYMAPEQATGEGGHSGAVADLFSLGTVAHFAATGTNPFQGEGPMASLSRLLTVSPQVSSVVVGPLREVIARCWDRDPAGRPRPARILDALGTIDPERDWPAFVSEGRDEEPRSPARPRPAQFPEPYGRPMVDRPRWGLPPDDWRERLDAVREEIDRCLGLGKDEMALESSQELVRLYHLWGDDDRIAAYEIAKALYEYTVLLGETGRRDELLALAERAADTPLTTEEIEAE